jgi:hypothetical protein
VNFTYDDDDDGAGFEDVDVEICHLDFCVFERRVWSQYCRSTVQCSSSSWLVYRWLKQQHSPREQQHSFVLEIGTFGNVFARFKHL